jgi:hypothetical protein
MYYKCCVNNYNEEMKVMVNANVCNHTYKRYSYRPTLQRKKYILYHTTRGHQLAPLDKRMQ